MADLSNVPRNNAVMTSQIIWAALLMGQIMFMVVSSVVASQHAKVPGPQQKMLMFYILVGMAVTIIPATFVVRLITFKKGTVDGVLSAAAFGTGNIIFWAGCECVSFFGMVNLLIHHTYWPFITVVAAAIVCQILAFPRKSQLDPRGNPYQMQ